MNSKRSAILIMLVLGLSAITYAVDAGCGEGATNENPTNINEPKITKTVKNGYRQDIDGSDYPIIHMFGTYYEMGEAHGQLLTEEIPKFFDDFFNWIGEAAWVSVTDAVPIVKILPIHEGFVNLLSKHIMPFALDVQYWLVEDYVPTWYKDEYKGLAAGSGLDEKHFIRVSMVPEIAQMACSMFAAWGPATEQDVMKGSMVHVRALAWALASPTNVNAAVLVYHPEGEEAGHAFSVWSWYGFVGAISGYSSANMGMSEKLGGADVYTRIGQPTTYVMRDILNFDTTVQEAVRRIYNTKRTNSCWLGIGDGKDFEIVQYQHEAPPVYDYANFTVRHAPMDHVMWLHGDDKNNRCYPYYSQKYYGKFTPELMIKIIIPGNKTGPTHIAVFDYGNHHMYVSSASAPDASGTATPAWARAFTRIDMDVAFGVERPKNFEQEDTIFSNIAM